jgi:hypothetical protein
MCGAWLEVEGAAGIQRDRQIERQAGEGGGMAGCVGMGWDGMGWKFVDWIGFDGVGCMYEDDSSGGQ